MVAGEASADLHGSNLVKAMKASCPGVTFCGIGGTNMKQAGVKILVSSSDMAVVGLTEVLQRFHTIFRAANKLKATLKTHHPDLLILIDYPDFNLYMARIARRLQIPVLYYISPQVWAWRRGRVKKIARRVDRMAVILPFEEAFYRKRGVTVDYVGHPLLDAFKRETYNLQPATRNPQPATRNPVVGLLPGSRREEIRNMLPIMIRSAEILKIRYPDIRCLLPLAKTIEPEFIDSFIRKSSLNIEVHQGDIYEVLDRCHIALVTSGTATLDTAIMAVPMVIVYKVAPLSYRVGKMLIKTSFIGLANLVAGERVVPELIQDEVTPERLADEALTLIENEHVRKKMITKLHGIRKRLGEGGASERTAKIAAEMMKC
ncbi:MAG: lipid-A-disaccharide synthase [Desulfobacteraceae bacterium]|nr:lipid-A-disaccharide synthase [Desulfobacteraceae bacterium]